MSKKRVIVTPVEGENVWVTYCKDQVYNRNNCINGVIVGKPGSGKSWGMLRLAYEFAGKDFKLEGNLFFKAGEMMRAIKDFYAREDLTKEQKEGKLWLLDEAGIDANALSYMDQINRGLNAFFQTARHRNYCFFCTVPFLNFISKGVRTLMNVMMEGVGYKDNRTILVPRILDFDGNQDHFYRRRLLIKDGNSINLCNEIKTKKPPKYIIDEYEEMKSKFTSNLFENIADNMDAFENEKAIKLNKKLNGGLTERRALILELFKQGLNRKDVEEKLGISQPALSDHVKAMEKLGIELTPIREGKTVLNYKVHSPGVTITDEIQEKANAIMKLNTSPLIPQKANNISFTLDPNTGKERKAEE